jgi:hypothetical protein
MITFKHRNKKQITHKGQIKKEKVNIISLIKKKEGATHKHILKGGVDVEVALESKTPSIISRIGKLTTILNDAKLLRDQTLNAPINFNTNYVASGKLKKLLVDEKVIPTKNDPTKKQQLFMFALPSAKCIYKYKETQTETETELKEDLSSDVLYLLKKGKSIKNPKESAESIKAKKDSGINSHSLIEISVEYKDYKVSESLTIPVITKVELKKTYEDLYNTTKQQIYVLIGAKNTNGETINTKIYDNFKQFFKDRRENEDKAKEDFTKLLNFYITASQEDKEQIINALKVITSPESKPEQLITSAKEKITGFIKKYDLAENPPKPTVITKTKEVQMQRKTPIIPFQTRKISEVRKYGPPRSMVELQKIKQQQQIYGKNLKKPGKMDRKGRDRSGSAPPRLGQQIPQPPQQPKMPTPSGSSYGMGASIGQGFGALAALGSGTHQRSGTTTSGSKSKSGTEIRYVGSKDNKELIKALTKKLKEKETPATVEDPKKAKTKQVVTGPGDSKIEMKGALLSELEQMEQNISTLINMIEGFISTFEGPLSVDNTTDLIKLVKDLGTKISIFDIQIARERKNLESKKEYAIKQNVKDKFQAYFDKYEKFLNERGNKEVKGLNDKSFAFLSRVGDFPEIKVLLENNDKLKKMKTKLKEISQQEEIPQITQIQTEIEQLTIVTNSIRYASDNFESTLSNNNLNDGEKELARNIITNINKQSELVIQLLDKTPPEPNPNNITGILYRLLQVDKIKRMLDIFTSKIQPIYEKKQKSTGGANNAASISSFKSEYDNMANIETTWDTSSSSSPVTMRSLQTEIEKELASMNGLKKLSENIKWLSKFLLKQKNLADVFKFTLGQIDVIGIPKTVEPAKNKEPIYDDIDIESIKQKFETFIIHYQQKYTQLTEPVEDCKEIQLKKENIQDINTFILLLTKLNNIYDMKKFFSQYKSFKIDLGKDDGNILIVVPEADREYFNQLKIMIDDVTQLLVNNNDCPLNYNTAPTPPAPAPAPAPTPAPAPAPAPPDPKSAAAASAAGYGIVIPRTPGAPAGPNAATGSPSAFNEITYGDAPVQGATGAVPVYGNIKNMYDSVPDTKSKQETASGENTNVNI